MANLDYPNLALEDIKTELLRLSELYVPLRSAHEALAVIREEYLEFEYAVFYSVLVEQAGNAIRLGVAAIRFLVDVYRGGKLGALSLVLQDVRNELLRATKQHGSLCSAHEALAVIREEYLEFERAIFHGAPEEQAKEAIQLGAMAARFLVDIYYEAGGKPVKLP